MYASDKYKDPTKYEEPIMWLDADAAVNYSEKIKAECQQPSHSPT